MYSYQEFAKAVYDELKPDESFEVWDDHTFYSADPIPPEMSVCERVFIKGQTPAPYVLNGENYILLQLSCTYGVWEIYTADQESTSPVMYPNEAAAREAWNALLED